MAAKEEINKTKAEVIEKISALMTAAFGLIAALAWNDTISGLFKPNGELYFLQSVGKWAYPIIVTIIAVVVTIWIGRVAQKAKGS
ncbi:MAG: DUF5654 family protein [Candidatus Diapherotrites archaeon]|nr:DUF5654 family protein [Candidatus Diapherotrites archaeon]